MSTPSIQTLITQAQQVLNLKSSNEIRATLAAVLANANVGTPLNPNLTTQQLWDEFYEIVRQPSDDIMSIITDQMMRMVFSPPAPGGAGADKQVIFNDGGVLAGDTKFLWDKNANRLDVDGPVVITGALTVGTTLGVTGVTTFAAGTALLPALTTTGDTNTGIYYPAADTFAVTTGGTERLRVNSAGNVGIGLTPNSLWAIGKVLQVGSNSGSFLYGAGGQSIAGVNAYYDTSWKYAENGRANYYSQSSGIHVWVIDSGTQVANTACNFTDAMTLDASGNLLVGAIAQTSNEMLCVNSVTSTRWAVAMTSVNRGWLNRQSDASGGIAALFEVGASNTNVGSITTTAVATAYNIASDYRLKESVQPLAGGLARISALKPSIYKWKVNGSNGEGFLAHELADVVPAAVTGEKDAVDADGKPTYQGVDLSKIVPILVAAIQELTARVQTLESR